MLKNQQRNQLFSTASEEIGRLLSEQGGAAQLAVVAKGLTEQHPDWSAVFIRDVLSHLIGTGAIELDMNMDVRAPQPADRVEDEERAFA